VGIVAASRFRIKPNGRLAEHHSSGRDSGCNGRLESPASRIHNSFRRTRIRRAVLLGLALSLVACVIARGIGKGEFSINVDEAFHACTGLYVASFLRDLPLRHPVAYTYLYYAHYPALQLVAYPPVFYVAEGLAFLMFGPTVLAARLTVLLFALFGLYFWFRLVAALQDEITAAVTTVIVAFLPSVLLYEKAAMLEIPALALGLAASYYWVRYLFDGAPRLLYLFAMFATLALLTKVQTAYLATWCLLTVIVLGEWRRVLNRRTVVALLLSAAPVLAYYLFSLRFAAPLAAANVLKGGHAIAHPFLFYFERLPAQLGWGLLALAGVGLLTIRLWERPRNAAIMLAWILACYVTETAIANKEARYIIYWIPPLVYLGVAPLAVLLRRPSVIARVPAAAVMMVLLIIHTAIGWSYERPYVYGYSLMARRLASGPGGYVLSDTPLDANLIFFVRADDPDRHFVINRKALYVENQVKEYGYLELAHSLDQVQRIVTRFRYIVVDTRPRSTFASERLLREVLTEPEFRFVDRVRIDSNMKQYDGDDLLLYENTQVDPSASINYQIRMLTLGHNIIVPRAALGEE
jgi:hypothetical protein